MMLDYSSDSETWLTLSDAAARLNVHATTLRRWADNGDIPVMLTPGGHRRFALRDVEQFAQQRRGLRRVQGIEKVWADRALSNTREEVSTETQPWLSSYDDDLRQQHRQLGQQLLGLTLQYISDENEGEHLLQEARKIGQQYGQIGVATGVPLTVSLQAALFFRDTLMETAVQLPESTRIQPTANVRLLRRINTLLNEVHLAIAEVYDAHENDRLRGSQSQDGSIGPT